MRYGPQCRALMMACILAATAVVCAAVPPLTTNAPAVPPAARIDAAALEQASRAALACAADFLTARAATNYMGMVVEPMRQRSVRKAYKQTFRKETYDHPIYEDVWDYEEVMVASQGSSAEHRQLVKTRRPIPGTLKRKLIRTEKRERLVLDPNGSIVREYPAEDYPEVWQRAFIGQNALALYALLKCGVAEDDPAVKRLAETLNDILDRIGLPDLTWDVAWLTCAFSQLRDELYKKNRSALIVKLLEGQITDGPARGLWGPICINTTLLSTMLAYEQELSRELAKRRELLQRNPGSKVLAAKENEASVSLGKFIAGYRSVAQQALRFEEVTKGWNVPADMNYDPLVIHGLPYYFYNQALADVECTSLALFAVREASRRGALPEELIRPATASGPILPPEKTSAVLARAATALASLQAKDGSWDEGSVHQPLDRMQPLGFRQLKKEEVLKLPVARTFASTAQACTALLEAGGAAGMERFLPRFRTQAAAGQTALRQMADAYLDGGGAAQELPVGRYLAPYDFIFSLRNVERALHGPVEDRGDLRQRLAFRVLKLQNANGSWGRGFVPSQSPALFWYEDETVCKPAYAREFAAVPKEKRQPYNTDWYWRRAYLRPERHGAALDADVVGTAYAMLFLESGLRGPAAGYLKPAEMTPMPQLLKDAIQQLGQRDGAAVATVGMTPRADPAGLGAYPLLFADTRAPLSDAAVKATLRAFLSGQGMLVVEVADAAGGQAAETELAALLPGGEPRSCPTLHRCFPLTRGHGRGSGGCLRRMAGWRPSFYPPERSKAPTCCCVRRRRTSFSIRPTRWRTVRRTEPRPV